MSNNKKNEKQKKRSVIRQQMRKKATERGSSFAVSFLELFVLFERVKSLCIFERVAQAIFALALSE